MSSASGRLIAIYGLSAACVLSFWPSTAVLASLWTDFANLSYAHGTLIGAVSLYVMFRDRHRIAAVPLTGSPLTLAVLVAVVLVWLILWRASIQDAQLLLLPLSMWLGVFAAMGGQIARKVGFPFAYLYFALPGWEMLTPVLQALTVYATRLLLMAVRLPASFEANQIYIPEGTIEIAEDCSGLHLFVVGMALAALLGEWLRQSMRTRLKLLAVMAVLVLALNWVRVFSLVVIGHVTDMRSSLMSHHYNYGWALFALMFLLFLKVSRRIAPPPLADAGSATEPPADTTQSNPSRAGRLWPGVTAALLAAPIANVVARDRSPTLPALGTVLRLPPASGNWRGPEPAVASPWRPTFVGASFRSQGIYQAASGASVAMLVIEYSTQRQGAELVGSSNSLLTEGTDAALSERIITTRAGPFKETELVDGQHRRYVIWSFYEVAGRRIVRPFVAQLWYGVTSLPAEQSAGLIALRTGCSGTCDQARATLDEFATQLLGGDRRSSASEAGA